MLRKKMQRRIKKTKPSEQAYNKCAVTLVDYYSKYARHDLPWRKRVTPYSILVSELMLQQTQVGRVLPKYLLWMKTYPTLAALRRATFRDVLILWKGLGYQRRAKALYEIAQMVKTLPKTEKELLALPGIGPYTGGAILAFAHNRFIPILETNIRAVLIHELYPRTKREFTETELLHDIEKVFRYTNMDAQHFYYACMDYGAFLKSKGVKTNHKVIGYRKQTKYKGSTRELRAKVLFAIAHGTPLPEDERKEQIIDALIKEKFVAKKKGILVVSGY